MNSYVKSLLFLVCLTQADGLFAAARSSVAAAMAAHAAGGAAGREDKEGRGEERRVADQAADDGEDVVAGVAAARPAGVAAAAAAGASAPGHVSDAAAGSGASGAASAVPAGSAPAAVVVGAAGGGESKEEKKGARKGKRKLADINGDIAVFKKTREGSIDSDLKKLEEEKKSAAQMTIARFLRNHLPQGKLLKILYALQKQQKALEKDKKSEEDIVGVLENSAKQMLGIANLPKTRYKICMLLERLLAEDCTLVSVRAQALANFYLHEFFVNATALVIRNMNSVVRAAIARSFTKIYFSDPAKFGRIASLYEYIASGLVCFVHFGKPDVLRRLIKDDCYGSIASDQIRREYYFLTDGSFLDGKKNVITAYDMYLNYQFEKVFIDAKKSGWKELIISSVPLLITLKELSKIDPDIKKIEKLVVKNTGLFVIHNDCFKDFPNLREIILCDNKIETLEPGCFDGLPDGCSIDLRDNPLFVIGDNNKNMPIIAAYPRLKFELPPIPYQKASDLKEGEKQEECSVCFFTYEEKEVKQPDGSVKMVGNKVLLGCGHNVCKECFPSVRDTHGNKCPNCRQPITVTYSSDGLIRTPAPVIAPAAAAAW